MENGLRKASAGEPKGDFSCAKLVVEQMFKIAGFSKMLGKQQRFVLQ
ncbi:MAG: hypothetical protein VB041_07880 [Candidatus Limiplasma sp.]|nr:hypothetical protein [Candidatus Limiplasma sp.]